MSGMYESIEYREQRLLWSKISRMVPRFALFYHRRLQLYCRVLREDGW